MVSEEERGNDRQHVFFFFKGEEEGGWWFSSFPYLCVSENKKVPLVYLAIPLVFFFLSLSILKALLRLIFVMKSRSRDVIQSNLNNI